jgi:DNA-binding NtrC family response regulator
MTRKGTIFPVVPLDKLPPSARPRNTEPYRPVILVVDDESAIADSLTIILKQGGYAAIAEYDAESALETALVMPPELVMTDVVLPGMNGIELAGAIRRIFPDCKVILTSGHAHIAQKLAVPDENGERLVFLPKPIHPKELLQKVGEVLHPRKHQAVVPVNAEQARPTGVA